MVKYYCFHAIGFSLRRRQIIFLKLRILDKKMLYAVSDKVTVFRSDFKAIGGSKFSVASTVELQLKKVRAAKCLGRNFVSVYEMYF